MVQVTCVETSDLTNVIVRSQALFKCTSSHLANDPVQDHTPRSLLIFPCDYPLSPVYHPATWQLGQCFLPGGVKRHPHLTHWDGVTCRSYPLDVVSYACVHDKFLLSSSRPPTTYICGHWSTMVNLLMTMVGHGYDRVSNIIVSMTCMWCSNVDIELPPVSQLHMSPYFVLWTSEWSSTGVIQDSVNTHRDYWCHIGWDTRDGDTGILHLNRWWSLPTPPPCPQYASLSHDSQGHIALSSCP